MSENRIDPTVAGLFLTAFITLVFGFVGILTYGKVDGASALTAATLAMSSVVGLVFLVLTVSAIRFGNAFAASLFGFIGVALVGATVGLTAGSAYLFFIIAIVFIVFALVALLVGAPKLLMILLFFVALIYLFVGLFVNAADPESVFALVFGLFGVLAGVLALYMAFALSTQKLPVF